MLAKNALLAETLAQDLHVLIKEIMQRGRACTFFHWEYPKEVDSCQKSNVISPQRIAFFNASENLRWFGELFAQTQSLSSLVLKNVSLNNFYISFNFLFHDFFVFYYNKTFQFALRRCLELPFKPTFCSNWPILCYHRLRLETCLMERV